MTDRLGLDSVSFDTFGWLPIPGDLGERSWRGEGVVLTQHFFPLPPDLALEPDPTGIREALALDSLLRGESALGEERDKRSAEMTLEETMAGFDPYHSRWDGLINDPLTDVRRHITLVEQSLVYRPEVLDEAPFRG